MPRISGLAILLFVLVPLLAPSGPAYAQSAPVPGTASSAPAETPAAMKPEDAAQALITILADEGARTRLVGELDRIAKGEAAAVAGAAGTTPVDAAESSFAQEFGLYTRGLMVEAISVASRIWIRIANLGDIVTGEARIDWPALSKQLESLAIVAGIAYAILWLLRLAARWPLDALAGVAAGRGILIRGLVLLVATAVEFLCLALAWTATLGAVATLVAAGDGKVGLVESIFANAFALIEAIKVALRAGFSPRRPALRLLPMADATARYWCSRLAFLTDVLGYGVLLVAPIVTATVSFAVGLGTRLIVVLITLAIWLGLLATNRRRVRSGLTETAAATNSVALATALTLLAPVWHILLAAYAIAAFIVWVTRPFDAIGFMVSATLQSAVTVLVGGGLMALISRTISDGIRLPADMKAALPLLESRLNLLVPTFLRVLRVIMGLVIVAGVLQAWDFIDVSEWAATPTGSQMLRRMTTALVIVLVAMAVWIAATSWIEYRMHPVTGRVPTPRARTLLSLFRNAFTILLSVIATMLVLSELGVDIAPLIAGAGVLGLAIGFGSQKLVQDIINGAFIQFENAINEGDVVTVAGISGVVERLTIRSVALRDLTGVYHIIPFSSVDSVSNFMRGFGFHVAELRIARDENIDEVKQLMQSAFEKLMRTKFEKDILEPLEMHGVTEFVDGAVIVRARIKTLPGRQWDVGRAYNEIVKSVFNEHEIALPAAPASEWIRVEPGEFAHRARRPKDEHADTVSASETTSQA